MDNDKSNKDDDVIDKAIVSERILIRWSLGKVSTFS